MKKIKTENLEVMLAIGIFVWMILYTFFMECNVNSQLAFAVFLIITLGCLFIFTLLVIRKFGAVGSDKYLVTSTEELDDMKRRLAKLKESINNTLKLTSGEKALEFYEEIKADYTDIQKWQEELEHDYSAFVKYYSYYPLRSGMIMKRSSTKNFETVLNQSREMMKEADELMRIATKIFTDKIK